MLRPDSFPPHVEREFNNFDKNTCTRDIAQDLLNFFVHYVQGRHQFCFIKYPWVSFVTSIACYLSQPWSRQRCKFRQVLWQQGLITQIKPRDSDASHISHVEDKSSTKLADTDTEPSDTKSNINPAPHHLEVLCATEWADVHIKILSAIGIGFVDFLIQNINQFPI